MEPHAMSMYTAKAIEYGIAVGYLMLFVPFWRFVNGGAPVAARQRVKVGVSSWAFAVPEGLMLHPGHGWVSDEGGQTVRVGLDDFARKLVGSVDAVTLPASGARLAQGTAGWSLQCGNERLDMLSPVDGTVLEVNPRVLA
jgi:glycine cleavage system H protein